MIKYNTIVFSDLDDTIWKSKKKIIDLQHPELLIGSYDSNNEPYSYITKKEQLLLDLLKNKDTLFIPVTARNLSQYQRTILYDENLDFSFLNLSTTLLVNNIEDIEWKNYIRDIKNKYEYEEIIKLMDKIVGRFNIKVYNQDSHYFYIQSKHIIEIEEEIIKFLDDNLHSQWDGNCN